MRNVTLLDTEKMLKNPPLGDLLKYKISLEELFTIEFNRFLNDIKLHEENYADAESWLTNKRDDDYLEEKMKMLSGFYQRCKGFRYLLSTEGMMPNGILDISS